MSPPKTTPTTRQIPPNIFQEPHPPAIDHSAERPVDEYGDLILRSQEYWASMSPAVIRKVWADLIPTLIKPKCVLGVSCQWWRRSELTKCMPAAAGIYSPFDVALAELVFADLVETEIRPKRARAQGARVAQSKRVRFYRWVGPRRLEFLEQNHALYGLPPVPSDVLKMREEEREKERARIAKERAHKLRMERINAPLSPSALQFLEALQRKATGHGRAERIELIAACRLLGTTTGRAMEVARSLVDQELAQEHSGADLEWSITEEGLRYWRRYKEARQFAGGSGGKKRGRPSKEMLKARAKAEAFAQPTLFHTKEPISSE